jgi:hypothetical protein
MSPARARMIEQREANVASLASLPLKELRRRQDMIHGQFKQPHINDEQFLILRQMDSDLIEAIMVKEFE